MPLGARGRRRRGVLRGISESPCRLRHESRAGAGRRRWGVGGTTQLSVEVRGRQRVRNVALGVATALLLVTLLAASSRTWTSPTAASCLRARQVVQASGLVTVLALVVL